MMTDSLNLVFNEHSTFKPERLIEGAGELLFWPQCINAAIADRWFIQLQREINWQQRYVIMYGKKIAVPRLSAWYGDKQAGYRYSGILHLPETWTPLLQEIKSTIEHITQQYYNGVLLNLYRNEQDSVAWHRDDEPELSGFISSLSLGGSRRFLLKSDCGEKRNLAVPLGHGSLLLMDQRFQQHWLHCVPKETVACNARINLTFRQLSC